mgnify:CR=1 FL=1
MDNVMSYILLVLALISVLMMLDIKEDSIRKRDLVFSILMFSSLVIMIYRYVVYI